MNTLATAGLIRGLGALVTKLAVMRISRKIAGSQSIHNFILHVKTATYFGYTYVAIIRLDIGP